MEFFASLLVVAVAVAILALRPYVPAWAVYALAVGLAFRQVLRVVEMGPSRQNVVLAAGTTLLAVLFGTTCGVVCARHVGRKENRDMLRTLVIALAVVISGCGAQRQAEPTVQQAVASSGDDDVVCRTETPTGSHLPQTRCYRRADEEQAREAARRARDRPSTGP